MPYRPVTDIARPRRFNVHVRGIATVVVVVICSLAAWFVLTARSVYIQTVPAGAKVQVSGLKLRLADHFLLRPGSHALKITAQGYYPVDGILDIRRDDNQQQTYSLKPLPGRLQVTTKPVAGAEIQVDGKIRGKSPARIGDLEPGPHTILISAERYLPVTRQLDIQGRDIQQQLDIELKPAWADVTVSSAPQGADVFVDDTRAGATPLKAEILQGAHQLRVQLAGYKPWVEQVHITAGEPLDIPTVTLDPADAIVNLSSEPDHASVMVNGNFQGQTPLQLALSADKPATLDLFKDGYEKASRSLNMHSGETSSLKIRLTPILVPISINASPSDADLYVDGARAGRASQTLKLTASPHRIRIHKDGYTDYDREVTPRPGVGQQINVALKTIEQARLAAAKPEINSADGQTLKLFRPDQTFTMGAPRREPGRRANEILRTVKLVRPFYLALRQVTNGEFKAFRPGHSSGSVQQHSLDNSDQPAVQITWEDAALYCNWLSARDGLKSFYLVKNNKISGFDSSANGYRLPTEAEWAWAARARPDGSMFKFPWGDKMPPRMKSGNYADISARGLVGEIIQGYQDGFAVSAPPGSFAANAKGLYDLGSNVSEWVNDYYDLTISDDTHPKVDPMGPASGQHHVIRGASWASGTLTELRLSFRDYGIEGRDDVGFRIARYLD